MVMIPTSTTAPQCQQASMHDISKAASMHAPQYKDLNENNSLAYNANVKGMHNHSDQRSGNIGKSGVSPSQHDTQNCKFHCFRQYQACSFFSS